MGLTEEHKRKMQEGRARAISKYVLGTHVAEYCKECFGRNPAYTDCEFRDCELYNFNTWDKRRSNTKTALKRAIKYECCSCMGEGNYLSSCLSPNCALYKIGAGIAVKKFKEEVSDGRED